ncbi:MAG: hypothetical protein U5Q03_10990 [Bacteroidota bacterium]|nr:hypothetical protein [Bacteroidota bacterium]
MRKLMHYMFLSCLKATGLIEKKIYFGLSYKETMQLAAHKSMCKACTNYEKHSQLLDKALKNPTIGNEEKINDLKELKLQTLEKIKDKENFE